MRIVHSESVQALGGQTLRLYLEARELARRGHECTLIGVEGSEFHARAPSDVKFVPFRFASERFAYHPLDFSRARKLLKRLAPDVVHTHSSRDAWIFGAAARSLGIALVRGRHISRALPSSPIGRLVYTQLADAFTASGETIRRMLIDARVAEPEDVFVTPGPLDTTRFDAARVERGRLRSELGLDERAVLVGTACNMRAEKGVPALLDAVALLRNEAKRDWHFVHAGHGSPERFAKRAAVLGDSAHFLGFRSDLEHVLAGLDVFVLASERDEATSQVIPQAMAVRTPVVATATGGIVDVVRDGETGSLVPPADPPSLARAIERTLELARADLTAQLDRAHALVHREYTLATIIDRYEQAYARARAKRTRR